MNYLTLQSRVESEILRTDMSTRIATWVNEARSEIADGTVPLATKPSDGAYRFRWLYTSTAVSTSTMNNSWPSDFLQEISILEVSKEKPLVKIDPVYFDQLLYSTGISLSDTGLPTNYIDRGSTYDLYPSGTSCELYLRYFGYPTALSANEDEEAIDTQVPTLIIYATCIKVYTHLRDMEAMKFYKDVCTEYYTSAVNKDRKGKWANRQLRMKSYGDFDISHWKGMHQTGEPQ